MRLFVAVEIPAPLAAAVAAAALELRRRVEARAPRAKLTWVPADRLHFTIRFIGEVADGDAERIGAALTPALDVAPFTLAIAGLGSFPHSGTPRVFWAGVGEGGEGMAAVEQAVSARLDRCGVAREARAYSPHLTVARVREAANLRVRDVLPAADTTVFGAARVEAITLFQSRLSPKGPTYVPLRRTPLVGPT